MKFLKSKYWFLVAAFVLIILVLTSISYADEKDTAKVSFIKDKIDRYRTENDCDYHIVMKGQDGTVYNAVKEKNDQNQTLYTFTVPIEKGDKYYTYEFIPEVNDPENYYGSKGKLWIYGDVTLDGYNLSDGGYYTVARTKKITVDVPKGATISYCLRPLFYRHMDIIDGIKTSSNDEYDTYELKILPTQFDANAPISYYRVQAPEKVTWWGFLDNFTKVGDDHYRLDTAFYDDPSQVIRTGQRYYEGGILLNGPGSKFLELKQGEYYDIYAFRTWQPIDSDSGNVYVDPTYRYNVIAGNDVISVDEEGRITAENTGVGIVEVTYDAVDYIAANDGHRRQLYSGCWPERAGIFVVSVNGEDSSDISMNIPLDEYSTVYYATSIDGVSTGETSAKYSFKPESKAGQDISVSVGHPSFSDDDTKYSYTWQDYSADENGEFTVDFVAGKNIVKVQAGNAVRYQVVAANETEITTENKYREGESLEEGDTAIIHFSNIATPIPKLGALYNPDLAGHEIMYTYDGEEFATRNGQYDLSTTANIELKLEKSGEIPLTNGYISGAIYGTGVSLHNNMSRGGMINTGYVDDMDNPLIDMGKQSILPDITIHVDEQGAAEERAKQEAGELETVSLGKDTSFDNIVSKNEEDLKSSQNFEVIASNPSMFGNGPSVNILANAKNPDSKITVIYYNNNGVSGKKIINSGDGIELTSSTDNFLPPMMAMGTTPLWDCFVMVNVDPGEKGYAKTYSFRLHSPMGGDKIPVMTNFEVEPESGSFAKGECILKAQDSKEEYDWGEGFIQSLFDYTAEVPARVEGIKITTASSIVQRVIKDEAGTEYSVGDVIPLKPGDNKVYVTCTTYDNASTNTYTFNFHIDELEKAKYDACKELQEYVDAIDKSLYKEAEQDEIEQLFAEGKEAINTAEDEEAVAEALAQAKEKIDAVERAADIDAAVGPVEDAINALPASDALTLDDKDDVVATREMYDVLTDTEKGYVSNEMTLKLAEVVIEKLELEKQLTEANNTIDSLTNEKNALLSQLTAAQAQVAALTGEKNTLEEEKAALTDTLNSIREQVNALSGENDTLKSEKAALLSQLDSIQEQVDALTGEKETLEADKAALTEQLNKAIAQVEKLTADNSNLESKLNEAEEKVKEAEKAKAEEDAANADIDGITPSEKVATAATINSSVLAEIKATDIKATVNSKKKSVAISFKAVKNAVNYRISYRKAGDGTWQTDWTKGKTSYTLSGLKAKGLYQFKVVAFAKKDDKWIKGDDSVINCNLIAKVNGFKVKAAKKSMKVSWKKCKGAAGYQVLYSTKKNMKSAKIKVVKGAKKTKATIKGLKKGKKYFVQIRPYKAKDGKTYIGALSAKKTVKAK